MSLANDTALAIAALLAGIRTANGYNTDAGIRVYRGRRAVDEDEIPCLTLIEGEDSVIDANDRQVSLAVPYSIEGHTACDAENPNDAAHVLIADIKRAIFSADNRLGGLVKDIRYTGRIMAPRTDGASIAVVSVGIEARLVENLAQP